MHSIMMMMMTVNLIPQRNDSEIMIRFITVQWRALPHNRVQCVYAPYPDYYFNECHSTIDKHTTYNAAAAAVTTAVRDTRLIQRNIEHT